MDALYTQNKILFDYFSFTIKFDDSDDSRLEPEDIIELLGLDEINFIDTWGPKQLKHRYYYDGVSIMFGGTDYIWCEMSGQGCRVYESYGDNDWFGLLYKLHNNPNAHFTRIDLAYDDFNGYLDLCKIEQDIFAGNWVSKARKIEPMYTVSHDGVIGCTMMVGDRASNISCRIYDKAQERNRADEISHWVRCELQIRHKHADNLVKYLLCDNLNNYLGVNLPNDDRRINYIYFAVLNNFFRLIDKSANDDSNNWRKPMRDHWSTFANSLTTAKLSLYTAPGVDYNVLKLQHCVEEQYGGMIYTYLQILGVDELQSSTVKRLPTLNRKYKDLLEQHRLAIRATGVNYE